MSTVTLRTFISTSITSRGNVRRTGNKDVHIRTFILLVYYGAHLSKNGDAACQLHILKRQPRGYYVLQVNYMCG